MNRVWACTDLHGMYDLWSQIKNYCGENDKIYFLGDAIDRGPDGVRIMLELLADKRVIYLMGNHENMFAKCFDPYGYDTGAEWFQNGGGPTFDALLNLGQAKCEQLQQQICKCSRFCTYENKDGKLIYLTHAGFTPGFEANLGPVRFYNYIWDRQHILDCWLDGHENEYCVFGHSPVGILRQYGQEPKSIYEIHKFCNGHKIAIDLGSADTGAAALLDLDTFVPKYFYTKVK